MNKNKNNKLENCFHTFFKKNNTAQARIEAGNIARVEILRSRYKSHFGGVGTKEKLVNYSLLIGKTIVLIFSIIYFTVATLHLIETDKNTLSLISQAKLLSSNIFMLIVGIYLIFIFWPDNVASIAKKTTIRKFQIKGRGLIKSATRTLLFFTGIIMGMVAIESIVTYYKGNKDE